MHIDRSMNVIASFAVALNDVIRRSAERTTGMSGGAPAALVAIVAEPEMTIDVLRRALDLTHPGAVRLVDRLVDKGWVQRQRGLGRTVSLQATPQGVEVARVLLAERENVVSNFLKTLSAADQNNLADLVSPTLEDAVSNDVELRRLCRLCDRNSCDPCPPWEALKARAQRPQDHAISNRTA